MIRRILAFILFLVGFNFCEHFAHQKTDGFSLSRIQFSSSPQVFYQTALSAPVASILQQPFHYLDCGNQCFVFASEDGQYVLKFFKYARHPVPRLLTQIPLLNSFKPFRPHRFEKSLWKQQRDLQGYQLAYDHFREETAIVAAHFDPSDQSFPSVTLTDKLHITHLFDLNKAPFILQKRATPIYQQLRKWISAGELEKAQEGLSSLLGLLKKRIYHQLQDDDVHFYSNFGFIDTNALQIDPGHFTRGVSSEPTLEIKNLSRELIRWCEKNSPSLIPWIEHEASTD